MQQVAPADRACKPLTESQATEVMWLYYRDHKAQLVSAVKDYRAVILGELMQGDPVEQVFTRFTCPPEPVVSARRSQ